MNQDQTMEIVKLTKHNKALEENLADSNRQLMKAVREKNEVA